MAKLTRVLLSGGLGNQLFQLALALRLLRETPTSLLYSPTFARSSLRIRPDLYGYTLPPNLSIGLHEQRLPAIVRWSIRIGLTSSTGSNAVFGPNSRRWIATTALNLWPKYAPGYYARDLQDFPARPRRNPPALVAGYFQNKEAISEIRSLLCQGFLRPREIPEWCESLVARARNEFPTLLHIRRGDYQEFDSLGLLSTDYYERALDSLSSSTGPIWIMKDDAQFDPSKLLPRSVIRRAEVISPPISATPAQIHWIMRHAHAFIMANSTFSWWAAALANDPEVETVYPWPWFRHIAVTQEMFPANWRRIVSGFEFLR